MHKQEPQHKCLYFTQPSLHTCKQQWYGRCHVILQLLSHICRENVAIYAVVLVCALCQSVMSCELCWPAKYNQSYLHLFDFWKKSFFKTSYVLHIKPTNTQSIFPTGSKFPKQLRCLHETTNICTWLSTIIHFQFNYMGSVYTCVCIHNCVLVQIILYTELVMYCNIHTHSLCNKPFTNLI